VTTFKVTLADGPAQLLGRLAEAPLGTLTLDGQDQSALEAVIP
jgi:hypothetical protein